MILHLTEPPTGFKWVIKKLKNNLTLQKPPEIIFFVLLHSPARRSSCQQNIPGRHTMKSLIRSLLAVIFTVSLGSCKYVQAQVVDDGGSGNQVVCDITGDVADGGSAAGAGGHSITGTGTLAVTQGAGVSSLLLANGPGGIVPGAMALRKTSTSNGLDFYTWSVILPVPSAGLYNCTARTTLTNPTTGQQTTFSQSLGSALVQ
jgi:hypothetical protein